MNDIRSPNFSNMSKSKIADWAKTNLGVEITKNQTADEMIVAAEAAIAAHNAAIDQAASAEAKDADLEAAKPETDEKEPAKPSTSGTVKIVITKSGATNTFPATLNGRTIDIPASGPATIPAEYLGVLDDSKIKYELVE